MLVPAAAALLLAALSLHGLDRYSFWRDEIASVVYSSAPIPELLKIVNRDREIADVPFMATYNVLLHAWLWFAETEAQIRLLSVIAGVTTTVPIYFIGRRLGGWWAGALGAFFFAASPYVIVWNREARSYSLAMLVSAALMLLLLRALERPTVGRWFAYGLVAAPGLYVHSLVGLVIAVHAAYVVLSRAIPARGPLLAVVVPLGLAALPFPYLFLQYGSAYGWIATLSVSQIRNTLTLLTGGVPLLIATTVLITIAAVAYRQDRRTWLVLGAACLPILLIIMVSVFRPMLITRYLVVCLPSIAVLAGLGLAALRPAALRVALTAGLAVVFAASVPEAYADSRQQDWRSAGGWIAATAGPSDELIVTSWGRRQILYYLDRTDGVVPQLTRVSDALSGEPPDQLWVVMTNMPPPERRSLIGTLEARYAVQERREFAAKVHVVRMTPAP